MFKTRPGPLSSSLIVFLALGLVVCAGGCTIYPDPLVIDLPEPTLPDHPCEDLLRDPYNCGECGIVCNTDISDSCMNGVCVCGAEGRSCSIATQACYLSRCRDVDLAGMVCEFSAECPVGFGCVAAHCTQIECTPEVCDGYDNDCDGEVDATSSGPLSRWCYDDDIPATVDLELPCSRGVQVCGLGRWQPCVGAVSPISEAGLLGCDGIDNDCDGCVDGEVNSETLMCVSRPVEDFDIVYAIDTSSSMGRQIEAVVRASRLFTEVFSAQPGFRFGLVLFPDAGSYPRGETILPLSEFSAFEASLSTVRIGFNSNEPSIDVLYDLLTDSETLRIGWRRASVRIIILFTDETAQTYRSPPITPEDMCATATHGEFIAVVTDSMHLGRFGSCVTYFELTDDAMEMAESLRSIIRDPCEARF